MTSEILNRLKQNNISLESLSSISSVSDILGLPIVPATNPFRVEEVLSMDVGNIIDPCVSNPYCVEHRKEINYIDADFLVSINEDKLRAIIAGGVFSNSVTGDRDIFLIADSEEEAYQTVMEIVDYLKTKNPKYIYVSNGSIIIYSVKMFQIVLKYFSSPSEVLDSFDINACMIYTDGSDTYTNTAGAFAILFSIIIPDFTKYRNSFVFRINKYISRGFKIYTGNKKLKCVGEFRTDGVFSKSYYGSLINMFDTRSDICNKILYRKLNGVLVNEVSRINYIHHEVTEFFIKRIFCNVCKKQKLFDIAQFSFYISKLLNKEITIDELVQIAYETFEPITIEIIQYSSLPPDIVVDDSCILTD